MLLAVPFSGLECSAFQAGGQQPETGVLEATALRAQNALQSLWRRARGEADAVVSNVVDGFHRQEHDALTAASLQLEKLGVDLDLNETGDEVEEDVLGCAHAAQVSEVIAVNAYIAMRLPTYQTSQVLAVQPSRHPSREPAGSLHPPHGA